jgi:hypothetical protein
LNSCGGPIYSGSRSSCAALSNLSWPDFPDDAQPKTDKTLREDQLEIRLVEMHSTLEVIKALTSGGIGREGQAQLCLKASRTYDWSAWHGLVDVGDGNVCYAGHSFGGTAVVS